jgi:hypothetical protein
MPVICQLCIQRQQIPSHEKTKKRVGPKPSSTKSLKNVYLHEGPFSHSQPEARLHMVPANSSKMVSLPPLVAKKSTPEIRMRERRTWEGGLSHFYFFISSFVFLNKIILRIICLYYKQFLYLRSRVKIFKIRSYVDRFS